MVKLNREQQEGNRGIKEWSCLNKKVEVKEQRGIVHKK